MKRILISLFGVVCLTIAMSSAVADPPNNPGGVVCDVLEALPLPLSVEVVLAAPLGCETCLRSHPRQEDSS